ncbi:MAG: putative lipid II flippase FtsW [Gammaproteobacteria bacterium]|nr:MAG: putative lipid II flippase FtsW [Gammaproteobacteria bacterium]
MSTVAATAGRYVERTRLAWDPWLFGAVLLLIGIGIVMVYSASIAYAAKVQGNNAYFLVRHLVAVGIGLVGMAFVMRTRIRWWEKSGPYLLLFGIGLLVLVLVPGVGAQVNGSTRWIRLGVFNLQPSEFMKLFMALYIAGYLVRRQEEIKNFTQGILMISIVVAVVGVLMLRQPDLGTVVVISLTVMTMLFLGGVRFWHFALVLAAGIGGMVVLTVMAPYRVLRVTSFLDPWANAYGSGFQLTQALIAFGRGEWFGAGLGASVQKLHYLPAAHTDFLFAVIAEELGLVGVLTIIALFGVILMRAFAIARLADRADQPYSVRLAQGLGLLLALQAMINMGVNMGALPTKGLTLPFVSYGGSSMIVSCLIAGLLLRIERETRAHAWGDK